MILWSAQGFLLHHHLPHSLAPERHRPLPSPIRLDLELLVLAHKAEEPVVRLTGRVDTVGGREPERHDGGLERRVGVFTADGEAMADDRAVRWLDGTTASPLVFADDHRAFHEDAKPGDLGQARYALLRRILVWIPYVGVVC